MFVLKKDAIKRLFLWPRNKPKAQLTKLVLLLLLFSADFGQALSDSATNCPTAPYDETAQIRYIHDGDTLHLRDGRKLRLIGINTPELARKNQPGEAYSKEAKKALIDLFNNDKSIALIFGKDKNDRYGRYLTHAFTASGKNVQSSLLNDGYAYALQIPPNTGFAGCYLAQERKARCNKRGLWKNKTVRKASQLKNHDSGFHLISGKIISIENNNKGIWLNLDDTLTVGIREADRELFNEAELLQLVNQTVIVRGWLNHSRRENPFYMRIRYPLALESEKAFACKT